MSEKESVESTAAHRVSYLRILLAIHEQHIVKAPFVHALRCAYAARGELEIVDVRPPSERSESIGVREYLEKWGIISADSKRSDVAAAGVRIKKVLKDGNRRKLLRKRLERHPHDLLVVGTQRHNHHGGVFGQSLAAYLANYFRHTTLFFPEGARPFIDEATGGCSLTRVVIPVENAMSCRYAVMQLIGFINLFPESRVEVLALHAGTVFPAVEKPEHHSISWREELRSEPVVDAICTVADQYRADMVIMATNGRDTFSQKIIGSNTEQVLGKISCPVLSVSVQ